MWKARKVAHLTHAAGLSLDQALMVDAAVAPYVDGLAWRAFTDLVEARIIEADPAAAEARRVAESLARFVSTGQSDEFGLKTLIVRATAGDVIFFVAMSDRIAPASSRTGTMIRSTCGGRRRSGSSPNPPSPWPCWNGTPPSHPPIWMSRSPTNPPSRWRRRGRVGPAAAPSPTPRYRCGPAVPGGPGQDAAVRHPLRPDQ